jgi:hypothetical protein
MGYKQGYSSDIDSGIGHETETPTFAWHGQRSHRKLALVLFIPSSRGSIPDHESIPASCSVPFLPLLRGHPVGGEACSGPCPCIWVCAWR